MFKNYLTIALRNLLKRKGYSAINLAGLSVGIAAVVLIFLFAEHELGYDRFHEHADDIYLVYKERITPTGTQITRDTWFPLGSRLEREYPSVIESVRLWSDQEWVRVNGERLQETITYTDASLFDVFSFPLVAGNPSSALADLNSAVISKETAARYFGDGNPLGTQITIEGVGEYVVTGVLGEIPGNSSVDIDIAVSTMSVPGYDEAADDWGSSFIFTYVRLQEDTAPGLLESQFPSLIESIWDAEVASRTNFKLEPLTDVYNATTGNRRYAYILLGVALVILVIGAMNFTNLATARSLERAREIGMRKALGARRGQVMLQFIGESTILSLAALLLALVVVRVSLPAFNELYGLNLEFDLIDSAYLAVTLLAFGILLGFLAGAYPALVLSRFKPIATLRGDSSTSQDAGSSTRKVLVISQFTLAIGLISGTLIMHDQVEFLQSSDLKFASENTLVVSVEPSDIGEEAAASTRLETFKNEIGRSSSIKWVSSSSHAPGQWPGWFTFIAPKDWGDRNPLRMRLAYVDDTYFDTYGIDLIEGRAFDRERATEAEGSVIINESARRAFGWETAVGRSVVRFDEEYEVVGVAADYHFDSMREEIAPVLHFYRAPDNGVHNFVAARIDAGAEREALEAMSSAWQKLDPSRPLPYEFADRTFDQLYESELRLIAIIGAFTALAILIACLGLLGLAAWSVAQRTKEVGIRKVLGATQRSIVVLLSKDFIKLVLWALVLAVPVSYVVMNEWLADFAYRTHIGADVFVLAGLLAVTIAFTTVSMMALRASLADPVKTLRYE